MGLQTCLNSYKGSLDPSHDRQLMLARVRAQDPTRRLMHVVQCPSCSKQSPSQNYKFQYKDLDLKIKCCECLKSTPLKAWRCNCGVLWHTCKVHSCTANVSPSVRSTTSSKSSIAKVAEKVSSERLLSNASFEKILDDDLRSEAKWAKKSFEQDQTHAGVVNPVSTLNRELRAPMLSPNLRQRFAHLLA